MLGPVLFLLYINDLSTVSDATIPVFCEDLNETDMKLTFGKKLTKI